MKRSTFILVFSLCISSILSVSAQNDHLKPVNGIFDSYDFLLDYYSQVRSFLLPHTDDWHEIQIITIPSFDKENVLLLEHVRGTENYSLVFRTVDKSIWYTKDKANIQVQEIKKKFDKESALLMKALFRVAIRQTHFPEDDAIGTDGTNHYFSIDDFGYKTGKTWSPSEKSAMGRLVAITEKIKNMVSAKSATDKIVFNGALSDEIIALTKVIDR
jgi:hypothetical protein